MLRSRGESEDDVQAVAHPSGWLADSAAVMRLPKGGLALYRHCVPRTPAQLRDHILELPTVKEAITLTARDLGTTVDKIRASAVEIMHGMAHTLNTPTLRFTAYIVAKGLKSIYPEVTSRKSELQMLEEKIKTGPVLLLPTHRSYMDFIILSWMFFYNGIPVPAIAAGQDFQSMAIVGSLLRGCGAFFMRRSFGADKLYWALFSGYVQSILTNGDAPLEFFVEGTRSRVGKSLLPKYGLLSAALRPYFERKVSDVTIIPISITYHERMEAHLYVSEMLGTPKPKESLSALLKARTVVSHNHGRLHIRMADPISLHNFVGDRVKRSDFAKSSAAHSPTLAEKAVVEELGHRIIHDQKEHLFVTVPAMLSAALIMRSHRTSSINEGTLRSDVAWIARLVDVNGYPVDFRSAGMGSFEHGADALKPAIAIADNTFHVNVDHSEDGTWNAVLLAHARNELMHVFTSELLMLLAIESSTSHMSAQSQFIFVSELLSVELAIPTVNLMERYFQVVDHLKSMNKLHEVGHGTFEWACEKEARLLGSLVYPFLQSYRVTASVILESQGRPMKASAVSQAVQRLCKEDSAIAPECQSVSPISNAIFAFIRMGVVSKQPQGMITLSKPQAMEQLAKNVQECEKAAQLLVLPGLKANL